jgi:hypothetical protein
MRKVMMQSMMAGGSSQPMIIGHAAISRANWNRDRAASLRRSANR